MAANPYKPKQKPIAAVSLMSPPPTPPYFMARKNRLIPGSKNPAIRSNNVGYGSWKADAAPIKIITIHVQSGMIRFLKSAMAAQARGTAQSSTISVPGGDIIGVHAVHHIDFKLLR